MNILPTIRKLAATLATATALCAAPMAAADALNPTSYAAGFQTFTLNVGTFNAGGFEGTWNGQDIVFWCIELTETFGFGNTYTDYSAAPENAAVLTALGQLFTVAYPFALQDAAHSAAFQLAIWEIVYDGGNLDLLGGGFYVESPLPSDAVGYAQDWLANLGADNYNLTMLTSGNHQDFVTFGEPFGFKVPEPAPLALLAAALLGMIVVRRRVEPRSGA